MKNTIKITVNEDGESEDIIVINGINYIVNKDYGFNPCSSCYFSDTVGNSTCPKLGHGQYICSMLNCTFVLEKVTNIRAVKCYHKK